MLRVLGLLAAILIAGCASHDRLAMTEFELLDGGPFRYVADTSLVYPLSTDQAEATRADWLEAYLADNGICPDGYTITERKTVQINDWIGEGVHKIYYTGECD